MTLEDMRILLVVGYVTAIIIFLTVPERIQFLHYLFVFLLSILTIKEISRMMTKK